MGDLTDKWNKSHSEIPTDKGVSDYAVKSEIGFPRNSYVCDLGGGIGVDSIYFLKRGHRVALIDISDFALSVAQNKARENGHSIETHVVYLGKKRIPLDDDSVDVVFSRLALQYFDKETSIEIFREIYRILKGGGKSYIVVKSPDDSREMASLKASAIEKESGVFEDNGGVVKSRFSVKQLEEVLIGAGITDFEIRKYVEDFGGKGDKVKSGNSQMVLNEIQISK